MGLGGAGGGGHSDRPACESARRFAPGIQSLEPPAARPCGLPQRSGAQAAHRHRAVCRLTAYPMKGLSAMTPAYRVSHLDALEAESIFVMREVVAEFERPVLLFSGGKDSIVMLRLAEKAFAPARVPFPVMHVDTGHNFREVLEYRDKRADELGLNLVV